MIRLRLALWALIGLGLVTGGASCQSASAVTTEELMQAVAELRAEIAALKRTVARLETQIAEAPAPSKAAPTAEPAGKGTAAAVQCSGTTKAGARCKRSVRDGGRFCWQHAGQ